MGPRIRPGNPLRSLGLLRLKIWANGFSTPYPPTPGIVPLISCTAGHCWGLRRTSAPRHYRTAPASHSLPQTAVEGTGPLPPSNAPPRVSHQYNARQGRIYGLRSHFAWILRVGDRGSGAGSPCGILKPYILPCRGFWRECSFTAGGPTVRPFSGKLACDTHFNSQRRMRQIVEMPPLGGQGNQPRPGHISVQ